MTSSKPILTLIALLRRHNIKVTRKDFFLCLDIRPDQISRPLHEILIRLLTLAAKTHFIIIRGLPSCLLPYARGRVLYHGHNSLPTEPIPACALCAHKRTCPGWPSRCAQSAGSAVPVRDIPNEIVFEITGRCNLSCQTCTGSKQTDTELSLRQIKTALNEIRSLGIPAVRFTGGEPFLHSEIIPMLALAKSMGFYVLLNTNATFLPKNIENALAGSVDNVLISLQGYNQASENFSTHTTNHSFSEKLHNLSKIRALVPTVRLGTIISPDLLEHFDRYLRIVKILRPETWELFRPMRPGASNRTTETKTYQNFLLNLLEINRQGLRAVLANTLPFCILPNLKMSASVMYGAIADDGFSRLVLDAHGFYKASYFMPENLGTTIRSAWNSTERSQKHALSFLPAACQSCDFFPWCRGGSRVMARNFTGTYLFADPLFQQRPSISRQI